MTALFNIGPRPVLNVLAKKKIKDKKCIGQKKLKTNILWLRVLNADIALKNAALDVFYSPTYKTRFHIFSLSPVF